jgi:MtN3 and saliva related transmembrane protein
MIDFIGYLAAFLTTVSFLPQVIKTLRTGDTRALSLPMYIILIVGLGSWLVYGLYKGDWPLILANGITFLMASIILVAKIRNG